jgi:hypothetical protein
MHLCPPPSPPPSMLRQDSFFFYLFGVETEDCYGAIDLRTSKSFLFVPRLPDAFAGAPVCLPLSSIKQGMHASVPA